VRNLPMIATAWLTLCCAAAAARAENTAPLTAERERALKLGDIFRECENCPEMVVVPSGSFTMGLRFGKSSPDGPRRVVTIAKPFAVIDGEETFPICV
jgi:formylglycine-generating enzyme required for sulfatase activity